MKSCWIFEKLYFHLLIFSFFSILKRYYIFHVLEWKLMLNNVLFLMFILCDHHYRWKVFLDCLTKYQNQDQVYPHFRKSMMHNWISIQHVPITLIPLPHLSLYRVAHKQRNKVFFFNFFLIRGQLVLIFIPHILRDISQRCSIWAISRCNPLFKSVQIYLNCSYVSMREIRCFSELYSIFMFGALITIWKINTI